jgi:hypothetical protein
MTAYRSQAAHDKVSRMVPPARNGLQLQRKNWGRRGAMMRGPTMPRPNGRLIVSVKLRRLSPYVRGAGLVRDSDM